MDNNNQPNQINPLLNAGGLSSGRPSFKVKPVMIIVIIAVGVVLVLWWLGQSKLILSPVAQPTVSATPNVEEAEVNQVEAIDVGDVDREFQAIDNDINNLDAGSVNVKSFAVLGSPFKFSLSEIKVKKGDTVRIIFRNMEGTHDWKIDEFNVATKVLSVGQEETIEFIAGKTGRFEYYCSVGTHRQAGMKGALVVE